MSKDDYVRILVHTPSRVILALAVAFGSGVGWQLVYSPGGDIDQTQRELDSCLVAYANALSIAYQHEQDIAELSKWTRKTLRALPELQRLEALNSAPRAYSSAQGVGVSH